MTEPDKATPACRMGRRGAGRFRRLMDCFYERVKRDDPLAPRFFPDGATRPTGRTSPPRSRRCSAVPRATPRELGGYEGMLADHRGLVITPEQRFRFASLLSLSADAAATTQSSARRSSHTLNGDRQLATCRGTRSGRRVHVWGAAKAARV